MTNQPQEDRLFGDEEFDAELNDAFGNLELLDASPDEAAKAARREAEKALHDKELDKAA